MTGVLISERENQRRRHDEGSRVRMIYCVEDSHVRHCWLEDERKGM